MIDPLRSDPLLNEQLDLLSRQIQEEKDQTRADALVELGVTSDEIYNVPDVIVVDNQSYEEDNLPSPPKKRIKLRDSEGHIISAPNSEVIRTPTGDLALVTPKSLLTPPPPPPTKAELEKAKQRRIQFRAQDQKYLDRLSNTFIETLANRDELMEALALSNNPKAENFLKDLSNPKYNRKKWTVSAIAHVNGLKPSDLADIYRDYNKSKGAIVAMSGIPEVMKDVVEDAKSSSSVCDRCDGLGQIEKRTKTIYEGVEQEQIEWLECPGCNSTGKVRKVGDPNARKILTEMAGYTNKRIPLVQQTFNNIHNLATNSDDFDDLANAPIINSTATEI